MAGPLAGVRVVEIAGIGPGPFCATMLADMGADIVRIGRKNADDKVANGRRMSDRIGRTIDIDLKKEGASALVLRLLAKADVLIEGFRPGVMERLGLGPEVCLEHNPLLIYGRMTGWGQTGPLAKSAGHDINYIAISGALAAIGREDEGPVPPLNLIGDFGGGGMVLAFGIACALFEAQKYGRGQVIDAAMSDGAAMLMAPIYSHYATGRWVNTRQSNLLDGGAHFYSAYKCADGKWIAVGALEPQFYALLLDKLGVEASEFQPQHDRQHWPAWRKRFAEIFASKPSEVWCSLMEGTDVCFAPVLDLSEAPNHPHNIERSTFADIDGRRMPAPVPRFDRSVPTIRERQSYSNRDILSDYDIPVGIVADAISKGIL